VHPPTDALQEYVRLDLVLQSELQRHVGACTGCLAFVANARSNYRSPKPRPEFSLRCSMTRRLWWMRSVTEPA